MRGPSSPTNYKKQITTFEAIYIYISTFEELWIIKTNASLNVKRQVKNSFSGFAKSRLAPALDDTQLATQT